MPSEVEELQRQCDDFQKQYNDAGKEGDWAKQKLTWEKLRKLWVDLIKAKVRAGWFGGAQAPENFDEFDPEEEFTIGGVRYRMSPISPDVDITGLWRYPEGGTEILVSVFSHRVWEPALVWEAAAEDWMQNGVK